MIPLNIEQRAAAVLRSLSDFVARIPFDDKAERMDRRIFRWVLCGECGFGRNWRERCPRCGGYVEHVANPALAQRLAERELVAEETLIRAAADRRVEPTRQRLAP